MDDSTMPEVGGTSSKDAQQHPGTGPSVRVVRGTASPEELSALIAVVAILSAAAGDPAASGQAGRGSGAQGMPPRSPWSSPKLMVRTTYRHGPGGWRASAAPR